MDNKTENNLELQLCISRMETCVARNDVFELTSQLLKYQVKENQQQYESLLHLHDRLLSNAVEDKEQGPSSEGNKEDDKQPDPL